MMGVGQMGTWEARETNGSSLPCPLSKKFLWEELELVREEVTFIYQKLRECLEPAAQGGGPVAVLVALSPLPPQRHRRRRLRRTW